MQTVLKAGLVISFSWFFSTQAIAEQIVYQWRDSNNVLHVSQLPPTNVDYQTIVLGTKPARATAAVPEKVSGKTSTDYIQSCTKAQENLRILQQDLPVYIDLEDGTKELLDDSKRDQQKQLAEKQIQFYCDNPAALKK